MGFGSTIVGGAIGICIQMTSNAISKIPLSRDPWLHLTCGVIGCYVGNWYPKVEKQLVMDINEIRADRGMPPLVGSHSWVRYQRPEGEKAPTLTDHLPRHPEPHEYEYARKHGKYSPADK